jgi:hypothetical protein
VTHDDGDTLTRYLEVGPRVWRVDVNRWGPSTLTLESGSVEGWDEARLDRYAAKLLDRLVADPAVRRFLKG